MGSKRIARSIFRNRNSVVSPIKTFTIPPDPTHLFLLKRIIFEYICGAVVGTRTIQIRSGLLNEGNDTHANEVYLLDASLSASTNYQFHLSINNPHLLTTVSAGTSIYYKQRISEVLYKQHDFITIGDINELDSNDRSDILLDFELIPRAVETGAI